MHAIVLKFGSFMGNVAISGFVAGVIYFVIAFSTGASALASIVGGILVAAVAVVIGLLIRAAYGRRPWDLTSRSPLAGGCGSQVVGGTAPDAGCEALSTGVC